METSLVFSLLIIFAGVTLIPIIAKKFIMPVIVVEIIFGIFLGKSFLDIVPEHSTIEFFASFGLAYIMFLAGLEIDLEIIQSKLKQTIFVTIFSLIVPFFTGFFIAKLLSIPPIILGTIFSTTSLGLILPLSKELNINKSLKNILLGSVILVDIFSMFLLAFSLSVLQGNFGISFFYSFAAVLILFLIPLLLRKKSIKKALWNWFSDRSHFEMEVRLSFALIFLLAAISENFGFHSIIGAFIAGLIISEFTPQTNLLKHKLEGFGYGFFIPLFFIIVGSRVDVFPLFTNIVNLKLMILVIGAAILSKVLGVTFALLANSFNFRESLAMGFFHSARLSLIIAAVNILHVEGFISLNLFSMFVFLAIVSAILGPSLGKFILKKTDFSFNK